LQTAAGRAAAPAHFRSRPTTRLSRLSVILPLLLASLFPNLVKAMLLLLLLMMMMMWLLFLRMLMM
jgi:hypothetical protein